MLLVNGHAWDIQNAKKPPSGQDFYSVLEPMTRCCRIAGVFPFVLEGPVGDRKYRISPLAVLYSLLLVVAMIASVIIWIEYEDLLLHRQEEYQVILVSVHFEMTLTIILTAVILASAVLHKAKLISAIDDLNSQDAALRKLGSRLDYATDFKWLCTRMGSIVLIMVMLYVFDFIYTLEYNLSHPFTWLAWICPTFIRIFSSCLFAELLIASNQRFRALNKHVIDMIRERKDLVLEGISKQYRMSMRLRSVATIHGVLCEIALSLNEIFAVSIVVEVVQVLIILTTNMYHIFHEIKTSHHNYLMIFSCINWGVISSGHVIYIIVICCATKNQATLTGKLIHKFSVREIDTQLNIVIQSFSLQMQHEKIEFSGAGLFPVDATLIQSIVGAVTTYLVILIQFDTSTYETTRFH